MANVQRSLSRALQDRHTLARDLDLAVPHRYVFLSDQHKGAGDAADEFRRCRDSYVDALAWYLREQFTLVLVGDAEELWENRFEAVERTYRGVLELEAAFPRDHYLRIWGNHDDLWMERRQVESRLARYLPSGGLWEGIRFAVRRGDSALGTLFVVHGHQGTLGSDTLRPVARLALRLIWRPIFQNWLGIGKETPARDACLRGAHDREMYEWATGQEKLLLIAGHTHRPVWGGRTHLDKLEADLDCQRATPRPGDPAWEQRIAELTQQIVVRRAKYPPCQDVPMPTRCYFNTGCCKFDDGDITGIELQDGELRLVRWAPGRGRDVLESGQLEQFFVELPESLD